MSVHLLREMEKIKKEILPLGAMVEDRFQKAIHAVRTGDQALAQHIMDTDVEIDRREIEVEEECLKVLALHQPVAVDLRFIIAVIKINNDLERIGDEAVNIAERVESLAKRKISSFYYDYSVMAQKVETMLKMSLD